MSIAKLLYGDYTKGADTDALIVTEDQTAFSAIEELPFDNESTKKLAILEHNHWVLDGSSFIKEDLDGVIFWSNSLSLDDCSFDAPPTIEILFDNIYTSTGITIIFDGAEKDICSEVKVSWYRDNTLITEQVFYPTQLTSFLEHVAENYNRVVIEFTKTNLPYQRVKVDSIKFGTLREFERDMLRYVNIQHDCDPISQTAAIAELTCEIDDLDETTYVFQNKQPLRAYDGDRLVGVYYITSSDRHSKRLYTIEAEDVLGLLDKITFNGAVYSNTPIVTALDSIIPEDFAYELDQSLANKTLTGYIASGVTCREALRQVCFSVLSSIITMGTEKILIKPMQTESTAHFEDGEIFLGDKVTTGDKVTHVTVYAHTLTADSNGDIEIGGIKYKDTTTSRTVVNPNILQTDSINEIEIKDMTLINQSILDNVAQTVYNYLIRRENYTGKIVVGEHKVGDCVTVDTKWGTEITGNITSMSIKLSNLTVGDIEVVAE